MMRAAYNHGDKSQRRSRRTPRATANRDIVIDYKLPRHDDPAAARLLERAYYQSAQLGPIEHRPFRRSAIAAIKRYTRATVYHGRSNARSAAPLLQCEKRTGIDAGSF